VHVSTTLFLISRTLSLVASRIHTSVYPYSVSQKIPPLGYLNFFIFSQTVKNL